MLDSIKGLFKKEVPRGKLYHMQDHKGWGDSITWTKWPEFRVQGHLQDLPRYGDILTCDFDSGTRREFRFISVEYCNNPKDMFFATVEYVRDIGA